MHKLTFYPLGNADCCLIDLNNGQKMLFDYADVGDSIDLPAKLREDLETAKKDSYDVVAITHADKDHIKGFSDFFYLQHAKKYQNGDRIKIGTLWVPAAVILETTSNEDHRILRAEARYRLKKGKGIRVFSKPDLLEDWLRKEGIKLKDREHLITNAGQTIPGYNKFSEGVEFFVHAPFSESVDNVIVRNDAALVVQATFEYMHEDTQLIMGADINHEVWTNIVRITQYYNRNERLKWDVFKISHHCSYTALSDEKGKTKTTPVSKVKWLFEQGHKKAILVSTSDPIPTVDTTQPPHRQASNFYKEVAKNIEGDFKVTMEHPKASAPEPLVIKIDGSKAKVEKRSLGGVGFMTTQRSPRAG